MSPIPLGILAAAGAGVAGSFDLLETTVLTSSGPSVTFDNLDTVAADYKHLQIRMAGRSSRSNVVSDFYLRLNNDTGAKYAQHYLRGRNGGSVESANLQTSSTGGIRVYQGITGSTNTTNSFGANVIDIIDPFSATENTTIRSLGGITGSTARVLLQSGSYIDTSAITTITLQEYYGSSFVTGSRFSLYGLKAGA